MEKVNRRIKKIEEHTYGSHAYMKLKIDDKVYEVDCYWRTTGENFKTTADGTEERELLIAAFKDLY